jgi:hypothetical protein
MPKIITIMGIGLAFFLLMGDASALENSCVDCHSKIPADTFFGSKFKDWQNSIHAEEGIACQRCHGGDAQADKKDKAHIGVYNSGNPKSRVYYKNVPGTCGACHRREFNEFRLSNHYSFLEQTGAGPTCVTCHESHTTRIIAPGQLPTVCNQCHNERMGINPAVPRHAQALLLLINETSMLVQLARQQIEEDQEKMEKWKELYKLMEDARDEWHAFNLEQVQIVLLETYQRITRFLGLGSMTVGTVSGQQQPPAGSGASQ